MVCLSFLWMWDFTSGVNVKVVSRLLIITIHLNFMKLYNVSYVIIAGSLQALTE